MRNLLTGAVLALSLAGCLPVAEPSEPTDAELDAYIREQQELLWYEYGSPQFERPLVESQLVGVNKYNDPDEICGAGVVTVIDDGAVISVTAVPASETAQYECQAAAIPYPAEIGYYTPAQLGFIYDHYRDVLVPCLQAQALDVAIAPTREQFVAVAGSIPWDPYSELGADLPTSRATEILQRCPALPYAAFLDER